MVIYALLGQLGIQNKRQDLSQFVEVPSLRNRGIKQIEGHFSQSACLLGNFKTKRKQLTIIDDNQILYWGYVMDTLTTARTLSYFKRFPKLARYWQVLQLELTKMERLICDYS